jgi:hydrogenase maturation protease
MRTLVMGLGNVLMGDDGFGPYVVRVLESRYDFPEEVSVLDVGTPGLDLVPYLSGPEAVVIVDTVKADAPPGTMKRYDREAILKHPPQPRISPHDPGLKETLLTLDFAGQGPRDVTLVGTVPDSVGTGPGLSDPVRAAVGAAVESVLVELERLGVPARPKAEPRDPDVWWER